MTSSLAPSSSICFAASLSYLRSLFRRETANREKHGWDHLACKFYCRSARLCLKRAALCRKSQLIAEELQHLKAFATFVVSTIPGHPQYSSKKEDKAVLEIESHLQDARKRIAEIEGSKKVSDRPRSASKDRNSSSKGESTASQRSCSTSSKFRKVSGKTSVVPGGSPTRPRTTSNGSRSESNTPLKSHSQQSSKPETPSAPRKSPNKIRALPRKLSEESIKEKLTQDKGATIMQDALLTRSKSAPSSRKTTPILQRLRSVTECLGGDNPRKSKEKEKVLAKVESLSREVSPIRDKTTRENARENSVGKSTVKPGNKSPGILVEGRQENAVHHSKRSFDEETDFFRSLKKAERYSSKMVQISTSEETDLAGKEMDEKDIPRSPSGLVPKSAAQCSSRVSAEFKDLRNDNSDQSDRRNGHSPSHKSHSAKGKLNEVHLDRGPQRRDEAAWTALKLQEQFGEALKELGGLQDRDSPGDLRVSAASLLSRKSGAPSYQQSGSEKCKKSTRKEAGDQLHHGWKSRGLHDLVDGKHPHKQREIEVFKEYLNIDSDERGGSSPEKSKGHRRAKPRPLVTPETSPEEPLSFAAGPHSKTGSEKSDRGTKLRGVREDCERFRVHMKALKEMADDSKVRDFSLHPERELLTKRRLDEDYLDLRGPSERGMKSRKSYSSEGRVAPIIGNESDVGEVRHTTAGVHAHSTSEAKHLNSGKYSKNKNKVKSLSSLAISPQFSVTSQTTSPSSSSSSSLSSLPLSHYIQKLKHLTPESRFLPSPPRRSDSVKLSKVPTNFSHRSTDDGVRCYPHTPDKDNCKDEEGAGDTPNSSSPAAIHLPKSPPISQSLTTKIQQRLSRQDYEKNNEVGRSSTTVHDPCQRLDAVLGGCALVASHLHKQISPERGNHRQKIHQSPESAVSGTKDQSGQDFSLSLVGKKLQEKHTDQFDGSFAGLQRLVGELKGSVEGVKIRIEVDGEGWRNRMEGLEKEIENLKEEKNIHLKTSIKAEMNLYMSEISEQVERMRKGEKDYVESLIKERLDNNVNISAVAELKKEIRSLWTEVEILTKEKEDMKLNLDRYNQIGHEAKDNAAREVRNLRRELRMDEERANMKRDAEELADIKQSLDKIKDEGLDLKMEVNGLKRGEKGVKAELENIKKLLGKIQDDTEEMERDRGAAQMEGVRERLLIMERVESLSQLYLGGLEEVRTDVYNTKFHCRDRMDELENQLGEHKRQVELVSDDSHSCAQKQCIRHDIEHLRSELQDIMENERGMLREALDREHECIRRQIIDMGNSNKNELSCMIKVEMQKRNPAAKEKPTVFPDPVQRDIDRLKLHVQEAQHNAELISQTLAMVEREKDTAVQASADATSAAARAGEVLAELVGPLTSEMTAARRKSQNYQECTSHEKDAILHVLAEAKKNNDEFQEFLLQEKNRMRSATAMVQHDRDAAATAASDASNSALKAGEVLTEMLGSLNLEMSKARRKSMQFQEDLDQERRNFEHDREELIRKRHEAQDRFNDELEKAITSWKRAMDQEVGKAKQVTANLEEDMLRLNRNKEQGDGYLKADLEQSPKISDALSKLRISIKNLEQSAQLETEEKYRRRSIKQDHRAKSELEQKVEFEKLRDKVEEASRRELALRDLVNESATRVQKLEGLHLDLLQSFHEIRASTGDLEKTASIWLPKYENAARIVHEINGKIEGLEEKYKAMDDDEKLMQKVTEVTQLKLENLKDLLPSETEVKLLFEKVDNGDRSHTQALTVLDARVTYLENAVGQRRDGLSLELEYVEKRADTSSSSTGSLTQTVEALQRKLEFLTNSTSKDEENTSLMAAPDLTSKLNSLESRIELVASATFTNLRLLDAKVEECSTNSQQALEGAVTAESKCSALGVELVKVFRMLASSRQDDLGVTQRAKSPPTCGRDHTSTKDVDKSVGSSPVRSRPGCSPPRNRSPLHKGLQGPKPGFRRGTPLKPRTGNDFSRSTLASEMRKVTTRSEQVETEEEYIVLGEVGDSSLDRMIGKDQRLQVRPNEVVCQTLCVHKEQPISKIMQDVNCEKMSCIQEGEIKGLGRLTISQDQADDKHKDTGNKCQRTNIRLEAGRIHVNVSHRSGARDKKEGTEQKPDLLAVQL